MSRRIPHPRRRSSLARACAVALAAGGVWGVPVLAPSIAARCLAQPEDVEGRTIRRIDLMKPMLVDGRRVLEPVSATTAQFVRNQLRSATGEPFRRRTIADDLTRLNRTGHFSAVETELETLADGTVVLTFVLTEQPIVQDVQAVGNRRITDQEIAEQVDVLVGTPVDRFQLDRAARRVEDLYRKKGYYLVNVDWDEEELERSGIVLFRIREGERLKVTGLRFVGNDSFADRELKRQIQTREAWLLGKAPLEDDILEQDVAAIYAFYRDRGRLDVRVDKRIQPAPNNREAIVTFFIEEGPLYTYRSLRVETLDGEPVFTADQLSGQMDLKPGDVYSINRLRRSIEQVRAAYHKLGYTDVAVRRLELRDENQPMVDLLLQVTQGAAYMTGEVVIAGNSITRHDVVRREVDAAGVRPDRPLDRTAVDEAQRRLRNTRLFELQHTPPKITLQPPDPDEPEYRDVLVEVAETNTGEFNLGAAVSSDAGVVGRISLVQRNFDLYDTPDSFGDFFSGRAFRGAGQTFRIEALPGDRVETYQVALSDPYLLGTDYTGSVAAFYRDREFREFAEQRYGARFGLGRRFGTRWTGNAVFRVESVDLSDISPDKPVDVFDVADQNIITGLGLSMTRGVLDDPYRPTKGSRTELGVEQVGLLGGDFDFTRLTAEQTVYVPVYEDFMGRRTVLSFKGSVGYIPQGADDVPVYERFYLGGANFRGFAYRTVSPKGIRNDTGELGDDAVGGTWQFFFGTEIQQPVWEDMISVVGFLDTGTVTNDPGFDDYRVSVGLGLRIYVPQLSPVPLAFDFGFPIVDQPGDRDRLFTFSLDVPF
ncbi:MAG: outer membrane protein assembly factor BamA [Phycisphaerales bacterium]|nr:outer membrane protein assembly factor BamA [Phycisphaerales bacterium]